MLCLVTGANSGVGWGTALALARQGHQVVMLCRDAQRGMQAQQAICELSGNTDVDLLLCDLSLQQSIRSLAREFQNRYPHLDLLINNAVIVPPRRSVSAEGVEMQLAVNTLAPFLLSCLLKPALEKSASPHIVNLAALPSRFPKVDYDDPQSEQHYRIRGWLTYHKTKVLQTLMTAACADRWTGIAVNGAHPGFVNSNIIEIGGIGRWIMRSFFRTPEKSGSEIAKIALNPTAMAGSGIYFNWKGKPSAIHDFYSQAEIDRVWELCTRMTSIS